MEIKSINRLDHLRLKSCVLVFTLYNAPQSTCSQRVRFVLNAKRLAFTEVKLDLLAGDQLKPDYLSSSQRRRSHPRP